MRLIRFTLPVEVEEDWTTRSSACIAALEARSSPEERSQYLVTRSDWKRLKPTMLALSSNNCWYCEAKSSRAPLDVDHFRPKLGTTAYRVRVSGHDGYFWLAFDWSNFRLSCQRCNRPERDSSDVLRGKHNEFPLRNEESRCALPGGSFAEEEPLFLDPCVEEDVELLAYGLDGEVKPLAEEGTWDHERARYTIDTLDFNNLEVVRERRKQWQTLTTLINAYPVAPEVADRIAPFLTPEQEYASFYRSVIGTHREKEWVETLLTSS